MPREHAPGQKANHQQLDMRLPHEGERAVGVHDAREDRGAAVAGRGYVTPNLAIDAELAFFRVPDSLSEQIEGDGSYTDFDLRGTYNFNKYVGFQMGWRRTKIFYNVDLDTGDLQFKGLYWGGVVRY